MHKLSQIYKKNKAIVFVLFVVLAWLLRYYYGTKDVGSFFEMGQAYHANYSVNVFDGGNNSGANHRVEGKVFRLGPDCPDSESGGCPPRSTFIEEIIWENGAKSTFDDCELEDETSGTCFDDLHNYYYIELVKLKH